MSFSSTGFLAIAVGVLSLVATGCTPPGENLVTTGVVSVERQSAGRVTVSRVDVYQNGEMLIVDGSLRCSSTFGHTTNSMGHVDVAIFDPQGTVLAQKSFRDTWQTHGHGRAYFTTRMPLSPPKGSRVRVMFHDSRMVPASGHSSEEWQALWKASAKT